MPTFDIMLDTAVVTCPYCGEAIELLIDASAGDQSYVEDCHVCCQPMEVAVTVAVDGGVNVSVRADDA